MNLKRQSLLIDAFRAVVDLASRIELSPHHINYSFDEDKLFLCWWIGNRDLTIECKTENNMLLWSWELAMNDSFDRVAVASKSVDTLNQAYKELMQAFDQEMDDKK